MIKRIKHRLFRLNRCIEQLAKHLDQTSPPRDLKGYLTSPHSIWFWSSLLALFIIGLGLAAPKGSVPRSISGLTLYIVFPGYALLKAAYPRGLNSKIMELALSIALSLAVSPLLGLVIIQLPIDYNIYSITITLYIFTVISLLVALERRRRIMS